MEHIVETVVLLFLGVLVIGLAISLIQPQMEESKREALYGQALNIAKDIYQSIESVAMAGPGNSVTLRISLPEDTSLIGDPEGAWINLTIYTPPKRASGGLEIIHEGAVSKLISSGTPEGYLALSIVMRRSKGWSVFTEGLATTGAPIDVIVSYPIDRPKTILVKIQGGGP